MKITQFQGEDRMDAIVNHFSLDIEEEVQLLSILKNMGLTIDADDDTIAGIVEMMGRQNQLNN